MLGREALEILGRLRRCRLGVAEIGQQRFVRVGDQNESVVKIKSGQLKLVQLI